MSSDPILQEKNLNIVWKILQNKHESDLDGDLKDFLSGMTVSGFRGVQECHVEFNSPVTAISGINGSGKSTFLHLAACSYDDPGTSKRNSVSSYFPVIPNVDEPINSEAEVEFFYAHNKNGFDKEKLKYRNRDIFPVYYKNGKIGYYNYNNSENGKRIYLEQKVRIFRDAKETRWRGYEKLPFRDVYFIGVSDFIPLAEEKAKRYTINSEEQVSGITEYISYIMGKKYEKAFKYTISKKKNDNVLIGLETDSTRYTQANMGFGEGRISRLVHLFEELSPEQSLFILDEPEIALHGSAQEKFTRYLMAVCTRRKHQIILTTHSRVILETLPSSSRIYLERTAEGIKVSSGIDSYSAVPALYSKYETSQNFVICEDNTAHEFIRRIFSKFEQRGLLKGLKIIECGDKNAMLAASQILRESNINSRIIHVSDGDMRQEFPKAVIKKQKETGLHKGINTHKYSRLNRKYECDHLGNPVIYLPGDEAPENVMVNNDVNNKLNLPGELDSIYNMLISEQDVKKIDHHSYFWEMANMSEGSYTEEEIRKEFIDIYIDSHGDECREILNDIIKALDIAGEVQENK